jgi:hypothetical protein
VGKERSSDRYIRASLFMPALACFAPQCVSCHLICEINLSSLVGQRKDDGDGDDGVVVNL